MIVEARAADHGLLVVPDLEQHDVLDREDLGHLAHRLHEEVLQREASQAELTEAGDGRLLADREAPFAVGAVRRRRRWWARSEHGGPREGGLGARTPPARSGNATARTPRDARRRIGEWGGAD